MVGQTVAYVRVSSAEQNLDRQLEAVGECDRVFQDKISGSSRAKRTGLAELMTYVREGDLVKVASMDRLGRDTRDLYAIVDELTDKGCTVRVSTEWDHGAQARHFPRSRTHARHPGRIR